MEIIRIVIHCFGRFWKVFAFCSEPFLLFYFPFDLYRKKTSYKVPGMFKLTKDQTVQVIDSVRHQLFSSKLFIINISILKLLCQIKRDKRRKKYYCAVHIGTIRKSRLKLSCISWMIVVSVERNWFFDILKLASALCNTRY